MSDQIAIERTGRRWAVKHNGSFLGFAPTREEASRIAQDLYDWAAERGRAPVMIAAAEPRSFAPIGAPIGAPLQTPSAVLAAATARASSSDV